MKLVSGAIGRQLARQALKLDKNSPQILFGAGVVGMIGSTVLACRATLKLEDVMKDADVMIKEANHLELKHRQLDPEDRKYTEQDRDQDLALIRVKTGVAVVKLYAPAIVLGGASIAMLAQSHNILTKRNAALMSAYAALEKGFAEYRQRVVDKYGEEEDRNFRYGSREVDVLQDGAKKTVTRVGDSEPSIYARFFDQLCPSWSREPEYNLYFLHAQQNYANDLLRSRGHVFLNEVYDLIGTPRSKAGSVVGWIVENGETASAFIDFGIFEGTTQVARDFVNGREGAILLDFNVDGVIWDKIDTPKEAMTWQLEK